MIEKEIWYCPVTKNHKVVKFASGNQDAALEFSKHVFCGMRNGGGREEYYKLRKTSSGDPRWWHLPPLDDSIPVELKAMVLLLD